MNANLRIAALLLACTLPLNLATAQDAGNEPASQVDVQKPKLPGKFKSQFEDPYAKLIPGSLPLGTSPEAAALFEALSRSTVKPGAKRAPLTAFDIAFEIKTRGPGVQRNQANVRVRFQAPGFVRFALEAQKEMGFGPRGYWQRFEDGAKYLNGREYAPDRKRITQVRSTAKNFLALADPNRLRIQSLRALAGAPGHVPPGLEKQAAKLTWLAIESPDFDLAVGAPGTDGDSAMPAARPRLFRATLGLNPTTGRVHEALVQELDKGAPLVSTSTWVSLSEPMDLGDSLLPGTVEVRYADMQAEPWSFDVKPSEQLYILDGKLNPKFGPDAFEAPRL